MKRVIVTGATGFVGHQSFGALIERGYDVIAVTSRERPEPVSGVQWIQTDLLNPAEVTSLLAQFQPSHLLHFAWYAEPGKFWTAQENFRWVQASLHLLEKFSLCGGRRIVTAGTCAEYDWNYGYCVENQTPLAPATAYGTCKNALQAMQSAYGKQAGLSQAWGRIFLLYGPREHPNRLVSSVIRSLLRGDPARCTHGNQIRDLMHVLDAAEAFVALLDSEIEGPVNIASGKPAALKEAIYKIADRLNRPELIELGAIPAPPGDPPLLAADTRRLSGEMGWKPRYDLASGLEETIHWWQGHQ